MHSKSSLPDELVKQVNHKLQTNNPDPEDINDDYSGDEDEFDDELAMSIKHHKTFADSSFI